MAPDPNDPTGQNSLTDLAQYFGNIAANRGRGRLDETNALTNRDRAATDLYRTQVDTALKAPSVYSNQAVRGDLINNLQDASFSGLPSYIHVPQMSGGLRPSAMGPQSKLAGAQLTRNALQQLMRNQFNLPQAPQLSPIPQASGLDKGLNAASAATGALGALGGNGGSFSFGHNSLGGYLKDLFGHGGGGRNFGTPGNVTGNYNPEAFQGIDPETGMPFEDPTQDPTWQGPTQGDPNAGLADFWDWLDEQNRGSGGGGGDQGGYGGGTGDWWDI